MTKQNTAKAAQPATDLRQRAARARDAAGRFIKRSAPVEPLAPPPESDPAAESQPHPDAALFALGGDFVTAWSAEEEAPDGAGYWACNRLAQQIVQTPAITVAGLGIKALLLARLDEDDSSPRKPASAQGPIASHWNVLRQVQEGAARLAALDMGIAISAAAEPETGILASAGPTGAALFDLLDLTSATMEDLQSLHDIADLVGGVAYAMVWTGRCKARGSGDAYNAAGKLMQWLGDALSDVESAANNEARRRAPLSRTDRETRLEMLALPVIQNGDPNETEAFARELLDHAAAKRRGH